MYLLKFVCQISSHLASSGSNIDGDFKLAALFSVIVVNQVVCRLVVYRTKFSVLAARESVIKM
jgi:hypothetical protein